MAERRVPYPLTVPPNFSFVPQDGSAPKTPERPIQSEVGQPVSVPAARFRVRRSTGARALSGSTFSPLPALDTTSADVAIPSIEVAIDDSGPHGVETKLMQPAAGYLSPLSSQPYDLPATPVLQTVSFDGDSWKTAKQREVGESILRPISVCSNFSSSSDESDASSTFASSYGGTTCTSPERGPGDPFTTPSKDERYHKFSESLMAAGQIPDLGPVPPKSKMNWSQSMDDHLWTTYQLYLQDPTMTPIKIIPGNAPPLGVCHRVARKAKQTWKGPKIRKTAASAARFSTPQPTEKSTEEPEKTYPTSDPESTGMPSSVSATWPKQNATRRRLRELAKNRATIPTHYMRLIASRSPSPFGPSSRSSNSRHTVSADLRPSAGNNSRHAGAGSSSMGTRGVRLALATATSETMQPDGPLARLQRDTPEPSSESASETKVPFSCTDQSSSLHLTVASSPLDNMSLAGAEDYPMTDAAADNQPPRLGSPFVPNRNHTWAAPGRRQRSRAQVATSTFSGLDPASEDTVRLSRPQGSLRPSTSTGPRSLRSPIQFTSTFPYNRSLGSKRRAEHSLEDIASPRHSTHRRPALNDIFGPPLQQIPSREGAHSPMEQRRVRLRGFSLNDAIMQSQQDRQAQHQPAFSGLPETDDPFTDSGNSQSTNARNGLAGVFLNSQAPRQLGSPFQASGSMARPRFRVRHLPHNSLDSYPEGLFGSIGERMGHEQN